MAQSGLLIQEAEKYSGIPHKPRFQRLRPVELVAVGDKARGAAGHQGLSHLANGGLLCLPDPPTFAVQTVLGLRNLVWRESIPAAPGPYVEGDTFGAAVEALIRGAAMALRLAPECDPEHKLLPDETILRTTPYAAELRWENPDGTYRRDRYGLLPGHPSRAGHNLAVVQPTIVLPELYVVLAKLYLDTLQHRPDLAERETAAQSLAGDGAAAHVDSTMRSTEDQREGSGADSRPQASSRRRADAPPLKRRSAAYGPRPRSPAGVGSRASA